MASSQRSYSHFSGSFVFFGSKLPVEYLHEGYLYAPLFTPPIPILPSMHIPGKYDLWAIRLLSITLFVPPMCGSDTRNSTSSAWLPLPIKMPRQGVRAILDTGECTSFQRNMPASAADSNVLPDRIAVVRRRRRQHP